MLAEIIQNFVTAPQDLAVTYQYTAASQLYIRSSNNALFDWLPTAASTPYVPDGLNRYASVNGVEYYYDGRGNLTSDGTNTYTFDVENRLLWASSPTAVTLSYDPLGRLLQTTANSTTTRFVYEGSDLVAEYDGFDNLLRRYVYGPGTDQPVLWYEGSTFATRNYLHADERGSIIATSNNSGTTSNIYAYGPYGEPTAWGGSRFSYTGQTEIPEAHLYYYKARVYSPSIGRFLQTDPIGSKDDLNLYAYAGDDPSDRTDPKGTESPVITTYSVCKLTGGSGCEDVLAPYRDTGRALELLPGVSEIEDIEEGNYVTAGVSVGIGLFTGGASPLRRNMMQAGVVFAKGEEAHHIVAEGISAFKEARDLLKKLGVGLDEAVNGAKLEQNMPRGGDSVVHGVDAAKAITERLTKAANGGGASAVRSELGKIGKEIQKSHKMCTPAIGTRIC